MISIFKIGLKITFDKKNASFLIGSSSLSVDLQKYKDGIIWVSKWYKNVYDQKTDMLFANVLI